MFSKIIFNNTKRKKIFGKQSAKERKASVLLFGFFTLGTCKIGGFLL